LAPVVGALASFVSGRRTKWLVVVAWVVLLAALAPLGSKLADETNDETESFLPDSAESTEVVRLLDEEFEGGQTVNGLLVYERPGGLTPRDRLKIRADAREVADLVPLSRPPVGPVFSRDRDVALTTLTLRTTTRRSASGATT
jgi:putative drug exporter of the RND superfamily